MVAVVVVVGYLLWPVIAYASSGDTSVSVSQSKEPDTKSGFKHNVEGELVIAMEEKIKKCVEAGAKNKMSYEIKA